jgi:hypothetical protein
MEEKAARAYDLAALKYWGPSTHINFPVMIFTFFFIFVPILQGEGGLFCSSCTEIHFFYCFFIAGKLSK